MNHIQAKIFPAFFALLLSCYFLASNAFGAYQTITNDVWWLDNNGNPIMAQGGGISKFGSTYYWYGVQYVEMGPYFTNGTVNTSSSTFSSINCYSSTDLVHWTFQNHSVTRSTAGFSGAGWIGRLGQVVYNSADSQYVMWFEGLNGQACCTCSTPTGNFVLNNVQPAITNVYSGPGAGDCTIFCDVDHGSTPYFICSDPHGRQHAYVCPLTSNYLTIGNAVAINDTGSVPAWPQGQEADNMFERNGIYYYTMSNLAGWSFSTAYEVNTTSIFTPTAYTADAAYLGTTADNTHYSQVSFGFQIAGTAATNYIMVGDRWAQFISTYANAGFGKNFAIMCPITFTNGTPYFQSLNMFQIDAVTGQWRTATPANTPTNLTATAGAAQAVLNWTASDGATAYNLYRSTTSGGPYTFVASPTASTYTDAGLQNGTAYYYVINSTNVFGASTNSAQVSVVPSIGPIITAASASPNPVYVGNPVTISATVTPQANPIAAVTVNASAIGGVTSQVLLPDGAGNFTNTVTVSPTTPVAVLTLTANAVDSLGNIASPFPFSLTVGSVNDTWSGAGTDSIWSDSTNWVGGVAPGYGYSLIFSGSTQTYPVMDASNNIYALTFNGTAGSFFVSAANGGVLTLTGGVTNNSPNLQTLDVPVVLGAPVSLNAASAPLTLTLPVNNGGNLLTVADGGYGTLLVGVISGTGGLTKSGSGTNTLYGNNTFTGNIIITNGMLTVGALSVGGSGQLGGGAYSGTIADSGTLVFNSAMSQVLSGIISGTGALNQIGSAPLTLSAANTLSGPTTITGGTLQLSNSLALQNSTLIYSNGSVIFGGITAATLGGLVGSQNLALSNSAAAALTLSVGNNNSSTTYPASLTGSGALTKVGTGTFTLTGANSYSGATTVSAGTLQLNTGGVINGAAANVVDGAELIVSGGSLTASASGNMGTGAAVSLLVSSGSATFNGGLTTDLGQDTSDLIEVTGGALKAASLALGRTGLSDTTQPATGSTAEGLYVNGGTVNITGNLDMSSSGSANSTASARIDSGSLAVGGTVTIGLNNGGRWSVLDVNGGTFTVTNTTTGVSVGGPDAGNAELLVRSGVASIGRIGLGQGTTVETAVIDLTGGSLYVGAGGIAQVSTGAGFLGSTILSGGILGAITNWSSSAAVTLSGGTIQAADVSSVAHNITLSGVLSGSSALTKTGGGILTLSDTNGYTGGTTVSGGTLLVNNSAGSGTGSGAVSVAANGTLGGTGSISGAVVVNSGGTFAPGNPLGTLVISNNLLLAAGSTVTVQVQHSPLTNSAARITGALTNGGTLIVSGTAATLAGGDTFKLFNAASYHGTFATVTLPALRTGLAWDASQLNTAGVITVDVTATPAFGSVSMSAAGLVFSGAGGVGSENFVLLGATNFITPASNWTRLWTNQFDTGGDFNFTNAISPALPASFYRLLLQ